MRLAAVTLPPEKTGFVFILTDVDIEVDMNNFTAVYTYKSENRGHMCVFFNATGVYVFSQ